MLKEPNWYHVNLTKTRGFQVRWALLATWRGIEAWGLRFRIWRPGPYAGMEGGIRFTDHIVPLWARLAVDYEAIARCNGWVHGGDNGGFIYHKPTWGSWKAAASWSGEDDMDPDDGCPTLYDSWRECCDSEDLT